jgi:hypothetical protein
MKKLIVLLILCCSLTVYSQPELPSGDGSNPDVGSVPINNGLYILLIGGLILGYYKLKNK